MGWKNYPTPNAVFPAGEAQPGGLAPVAAVFLWTSWGVFVAGCIWTLIAYPVMGDADIWINLGLWAGMLGWAMLFAALPFYGWAMTRRMLRQGDVIPALTQPRKRQWWFLILVSGPLCLVSMGLGIVGAIATRIERAYRMQLTVEYVADGRVRKCTMWVKKRSLPHLCNAEVWITRPRLFVPPRPVDRHGTLGELDHCTIEAKDWLWHAFGRAFSRAAERRTLRRRAKAIRRIRHDRGRGGAYR